MKVLSLFDGMSCLQIALKELGIIPEKYYASEIDKYAIKQTQLNFPDTIQLGSVTEWRSWDIDWSSIGLIGAGSPCQGFSFAGKQLAFDDQRSKLFFEFAGILRHCRKLNPDVKFLLENVDMKKDHLRIISEYVGVFPENINSNLVSAQNRSRWYWSNIRIKKVGLFDEVYTDIPQPKDEGILLKNILEDEVDEKYFISEAVLSRIERKSYSEPKFNKTGTLSAGNNSAKMSIDSGTTFISINGKAPNQRSSTGRSLDKKHNYQIINLDGNPKQNQDKASYFTAGAHSGGNHSDMDLICVATSVQKDNLVMTANYIQWDGVEFDQDNRAYFEDGKSGTIDVKANRQKVAIQLNPSLESGGKQPYQHNRVYSDEGLMTCLDTDSGIKSVLTNSRIRRLTPLECSRLQTIPEWYKWDCSDTQIYRMLGNGWTVKVIEHILSYLISQNSPNFAT